MSFRGKLRLFFASIVVLPISAMALVVFPLTERSERGQVDAANATALDVAFSLYADGRREARRALSRLARDELLAAALRARDGEAARGRLLALSGEDVVSASVSLPGGERLAAVGAPDGVAPARTALSTPDGEALGSVALSSTDADGLAATIERRTGRGALVLRGGRVLARAGSPVARVAQGAADASGGGESYRSLRRRAGRTGGAVEEIATIGPARPGGAGFDTRLILGGVLLLVLLVAVVGSALILRALHSQVDGFLHAARRLGRGRFDRRVAVNGDDAFAHLGREFNSMSDQLEAKIGEVERKRKELEETIRRVGRAFATGLEPQSVFELTVQTAVDACEADVGRGLPLDERMLTVVCGSIDHASREALIRAEHEAVAVRPETGRELLATHEPDALPARQHDPVAGEHDGVHTLSLGLMARLGPRTHVSHIGVLSIARADRPFASADAEMLSYLAGQAVVSIENADLHETVRRQAVTDELTGLANVREMQSALDREFERGRRHDTSVGFLLMDIDDFKQVNDTYGHQQGDEVLQAVAELLREASRDIDEPARYGGEELAVVLPQTELDGAVRMAERVRASIERLRIPLLAGDGDIQVTASIGVACLPTSASAKEDLIARADEALYRAKRGGKNRVERAEGVPAVA